MYGYLTMAQWLRKNPDSEAVLLAAGHFIHVRSGKVVTDNGYSPMRGRVTWVVLIERKA